MSAVISQIRTLLVATMLMALPGCQSDAGTRGEPSAKRAKTKKKSKKKKKKSKKKKKARKRKDVAKPAASAPEHAVPDASGRVPPPTPGMTITPRVGAWVKYATRPKVEDPGTLQWAVVAEPKPKNYLIELEMSDGRQKFLTQADATIVDLRDPDGNTFKGFRFLVPGHSAVSLPETFKGRIRDSIAAFFRLANPSRIEGAPQEDVQVKGGSFRGCYKIDGPGVVFGVKIRATHWVHPAVPLPGIVKTVSSEGEMELQSYGLEGAKSQFP